MHPIPKKLLIHAVTLSKVESKDRWGKETEGEGMELKYVRMEPSGKVVRDKNNAEVQLSAVLFYDCKNSSPKGIQFCEDDKITFNGQKHRIQTIEPLYDRKKLHHYEIGVIKDAKG